MDGISESNEEAVQLSACLRLPASGQDMKNLRYTLMDR